MDKQTPPYAIQVEMTEGCNLACSFCGINGIREKAGGPYKFMSPAVADKLAQGIADTGWNSRIEFAMHGEPTMNPQMHAIISAFRKRLPGTQLMMTSNGGGLLKDTSKTVDLMFECGLNILALDDYQGVKIVSKIQQRYTGAAQMVRYPQDGLNLSPHHRWKKGSKVIILIQDLLEAADGGHSSLTNHCGGGAPKNNSAAGKRCAKPFRELSLRWDGNVALCCNDFRGIYKVGNATVIPLADLWNSPAFYAARQKLYSGERDFGACAGCDQLSYRVGLLPDAKGKFSMPKPDALTERAISKALRGGSYTPIVLRPWEKS